MNRTTPRALLAGLVSAAVAVSVLLAASPASAAPLIPGNEINGGDYTFTLTPSSAAGIDPDAGESVLNLTIGSLSISTGCPEGYRTSSRSFIVTPDGTEKGVALRRENRTAELFGLQGRPIQLEGEYAANFAGLTATTLPTGTNRLVITCDAQLGDADGVVGDSKYFFALIEVDRAANSWKQVAKPTTPVQKTATTTALAASGTTATSTTLTATVAPAAATGKVAFSQGGTAIGQADVVGGVATWGATGLTGDTEYAFTAQYLGDATHEASTAPAVTVKTAVAVPPSDTTQTEVTVSVPAAAGGPEGLRITTSPGAVTLTGTQAQRAAGQAWAATGTLGNVTVTDARPQDARKAWSLSGQASPFTATAGSFGANALGWSPEKVSGDGTAGAASTDLSAARALATGAASTGAASVTTVKAGLSLAVPATAPAGDYKAMLTLTLI